MARRKDSYEFGESLVTVAGAANFIVDHVQYTASTRRSAYDTIFKTIRIAQTRGELPKGRSIPAAVLFGWAISKRVWVDLEEISGLPQSVSISLGGVGAVGLPSFAATAQLPNSVEALKELISQKVLDLEQKDHEIADLKSELEVFRAQKRRRSGIAAANGKKGGRGRVK